MKAICLFLLGVIGFSPSVGGAQKPKKTQSEAGHVKVAGHTTKRGKRVSSHERTTPNKTERDNWSTKGNVNPHTGKRGTKIPKR